MYNTIVFVVLETKKIMEQKEDFEAISEKTAQMMCDALAEFNKSVEDNAEMLDKYYNAFSTNLKAELAARLIDYLEKIVQASFITRWYWIRKAKKVYSCIRWMIEIGEMYGDNKS